MHYWFDPDIARKYSVDEAIILAHLEFWIFTNRANGRNFHDRRTWTYNSLRGLAEIWPFWSMSHIWRTLDKLVQRQVLVKGNYNKIRGYDRTTWYAFKDEELWFKSRESILQKRKMEIANSKNPFCETETPIPNPNPDTSTHKKQLRETSSKRRDLELVVSEDKAIVEGKNRFMDALNRILRPTNSREAKTFARIVKHLITLCETDKREPNIFDDAIIWMKEAKADGKRPKALFVAMVKEKTGFAAQKRLLTGQKPNKG